MTKKKEEADESQRDNKIQQEVEKAEKMRAENCKASKYNLEIYTAYRRVTNEKGETVRLDDNERAARIQEAKEGIKEFCD